jgi:2-polyprenyl-3-methyl-5-hydroxy-6-metoxy-1,4-benzoquinol methylase
MNQRSAVVQIGTPPVAYYDGILMRANPVLHTQAFDILRTIVPTGRVIDLGSGQGAFAARLRDHGYTVTSVDKNPSDFRAPGVEFIPVDFDVSEQVDAFKADHHGRYDIAIGMEVIEHVENPWEYCRLLLSLVREGGIVMITTPNAESLHSRLDFLFGGRFAHFTRQDFEDSGHINPLTFSELELIAEGVGAEIINFRSLCALPWLIVSRRPGVVFKSVIGSLLRPFLGRRASGDIICMVLKKSSASHAASTKA